MSVLFRIRRLFFRIRRVVLAALNSSRGLAYLSTVLDAGGLNCRVRKESGCIPTAMAAITTSQGPDLNWGVADLQSAAWPLRHLGAVYVLLGVYMYSFYRIKGMHSGFRLGSTESYW